MCRARDHSCELSNKISAQMPPGNETPVYHNQAEYFFITAVAPSRGRHLPTSCTSLSLTLPDRVHLCLHGILVLPLITAVAPSRGRNLPTSCTSLLLTLTRVHLCLHGILVLPLITAVAPSRGRNLSTSSTSLSLTLPRVHLCLHGILPVQSP